MSFTDVTESIKKFEQSLEMFVQSIIGATSAYEEQGGPGSTLAYGKWKNTALVLLSKDLGELSQAASLSRTADVATALRIAQNEVGLGKKLDTFTFEFAGEAHIGPLRRGMEMTVHTASELINSIASLA